MNIEVVLSSDVEALRDGTPVGLCALGESVSGRVILTPTPGKAPARFSSVVITHWLLCEEGGARVPGSSETLLQQRRRF